MSEGSPISGGQVVLLPTEAVNAHVDRLHLDRASREALRAVGIETIGQLAGDGFLSQQAWDSLGRQRGKEASAVVRVLSDYCDGDLVEWAGFWAARGVAVVPGTVTGAGDVASLLAALPQLIHAALLDDAWPGTDPERDWIIIDARNGLVSTPKTLEELGYAALGITRARVQQLEAKAWTRLRHAWGERFHGGRYRLHPDLDDALGRVMDAVVESREIVFDDDLVADLGLPAKANDRDQRRLGFLLALGGARHVDPDGERRPGVWLLAGDKDARSRLDLGDRIGRLLCESTPDAMTETDIVVELNRGRRSSMASLLEVRAAMLLSRTIERLDDGRWQGRFEFLTRRGDQAYRVISAAGQPVDLDLVVREINAASRSRPVSVRNLANQLSGDDRFVPIGKSGEWGLAATHAADAGPIVGMMVDALRRAGHPLTASEIQTSVQARRKVAESSVPIYLQMRPEFARLPGRMWGLSEWPEAAATAVPNRAGKPRVRRQPTLADRMEAVVVPYLQATPDRERDLVDVVHYVSETLGVISNTVYPYLERIPGIQRAIDGDRRVVRLVGTFPAPDAPEVALRDLIRGGETPRVEFKSTLRWDVRQGADSPGLQKMCTKTVAAFSNTSGGVLVTGVAPDGDVSGIEPDCAVLRRKDDTCVDAFSRALAAILSQHLGAGVTAQVSTSYEQVEGRTVCVVDVPRGREPVYLRDGKTVEFYVRNGTTSRALELPEVTPYITSHWS